MIALLVQLDGMEHLVARVASAQVRVQPDDTQDPRAQQQLQPVRQLLIALAAQQESMSMSQAAMLHQIASSAVLEDTRL